MQYVFGGLIAIAFAALAYVNRGSPLLMGALIIIGVMLSVFAGAGRFDGDAA